MGSPTENILGIYSLLLLLKYVSSLFSLLFSTISQDSLLKPLLLNVGSTLKTELRDVVDETSDLEDEGLVGPKTESVSSKKPKHHHAHHHNTKHQSLNHSPEKDNISKSKSEDIDENESDWKMLEGFKNTYRSAAESAAIGSSQLKTWASVGTGLLFTYLTGSHKYLLDILNTILLVATNLPTFCSTGAPFIAVVMKLCNFKFSFLKGWYVLIILLSFFRPLLMMIDSPNNPVKMVIEVGLPLAVFLTYQVEERAFVRMFREFSAADAQRWLIDTTEEVFKVG